MTTINASSGTNASPFAAPGAVPDVSESRVRNSEKRHDYTSANEDEEMTYADVNRQVALIINVLVSIVACGVALWMAARHWSVPSRLGLSMGGGGLVGVAEVAIYAGYLRRLTEAKQKEKKKTEKKEVFETWVIGRSEADEKSADPKPSPTDLRRRAVASKGS